MFHVEAVAPGPHREGKEESRKWEKRPLLGAGTPRYRRRGAHESQALELTTCRSHMFQSSMNLNLQLNSEKSAQQL